MSITEEIFDLDKMLVGVEALGSFMVRLGAAADGMSTHVDDDEDGVNMRGQLVQATHRFVDTSPEYVQEQEMNGRSNLPTEEA